MTLEKIEKQLSIEVLGPIAGTLSFSFLAESVIESIVETGESLIKSLGSSSVSDLSLSVYIAIDVWEMLKQHVDVFQTILEV